jgi:hypothetical protein
LPFFKQIVLRLIDVDRSYFLLFSPAIRIHGHWSSFEGYGFVSESSLRELHIE